MLDTVAVPEQFEPIFRKAQEYVSAYFGLKKEDASTGTIEVFGQRYILVRAASMSVDFFDTIKGMFKDCGEEKASEMARSLLFDVAHTIGKMDARNFHQRMALHDPIEKLSAGPIHFSHTGWAFVDISAESKPIASEDYYLLYDHPFSFEADAWEKSGKKSTSCVCTMNAGYSSGWCEESFGIPLIASEIMCKARGDSACRFIMAHPSKISQYLQAYLCSHPEISDNAVLYRTGGFFQKFRQVQEALRKSEERFEQVTANAGDWIWEVNAEGLYTYSSPVVEKILGYKPEEIVGKKYFYDFFASDVKEKLKKATFEAFAGGEGIKNFVNPKVHKNGSIVILDTNSTPVVDDKGNLCGYRGADRDITEYKQAGEALRKSEYKFHTLFTSSRDGIATADLDGHITECNQAYADMLGYSPEELRKTTFLKLTPGKWHRQNEEMVKDVLVKGYSDEFEKEYLRKDGTILPVSLRTWRINDDKGNISGICSIARDITERKRAEERLLAVNTLLKLLLPPAPIEQKLKVVTDTVVRILDADFARIWVIKPGDRCEAGCTHAQITEGPHVCRFRDRCLHLMASSGRYTHIDGKDHCRVPFGCYKIGLIAAGEQDKFLTNEAATDPRVHNQAWARELGLVSFAGYRLTHTDGTPLGVLALFSKHTISPEEDALLERIAYSTSMVLHASRTEESIENLNKDLKSTVALLTQSNRQLSEFAYLAAHDLKTPLRGIGTLAQWLVGDYQEKFDDEGRRQIDLLVKRVERMNELINAILQYSTITRNRDNEHPADLNTLVETILVEIRPPPNIKIAINKNLPVVICNKTHLQQVFCHLLANAIRFMDKSEGHITIDYADKNDIWEFSISDNGPGIAPQHFERIFRLFQTLGDREQSQGTGIGLTVVKKIVELYDGRIWLTSELGQGSTFFFTLPKVLSVTNKEEQLLTASC